MTPKEYLLQYRDAVKEYYAAVDHLNELRAVAERITPVYGRSGGIQNQSEDKLGVSVLRIIAAENRISDTIELLIATEREIEYTVNAVKDGTLRTLLKERYINGKTWEQIAVAMDYSYVHIVHRLHPLALRAVAEMITKQKKPPSNRSSE